MLINGLLAGSIIRGSGLRRFQGGSRVVLPARSLTQAAIFDGSDHSGTSANTAGNADVATSALSQHSQLMTFFGRFRPYRLGNLMVLFAVADGSANRICVVMLSDGRVRVLFGAATPGATFPSNEITNSAVFLSDDVEVSIGVTIDLSDPTPGGVGRCTIYADGVAQTTTINGSIPGSIATNAVPFTIGQATGVSTGSALPWHGQIRDVVACIGKAASAGEQTTLHAGGTIAGETGRWGLDGDWNDSIGAAHFAPAPSAPAGPDFIPLARTFPTAGTFRVGSLGDSNWYGSPYGVGYMRAMLVRRLYHLLGVQVDVVGDYADGAFPGMRDLEHGGLPSRRIGASTSDATPVPSGRFEIANGWLSRNPADAYIIWLGTNEFTNGVTGADALTRASALIDEFRAISSAPIGWCTPPRIDAGTDTERAAFKAGLSAMLAGKADCTELLTEEEQGSIRGLATGDNVHQGRAMAEKAAKPIATWVASLI